MKNISTLFLSVIILTITSVSCEQSNNYPGQLKIRSYKIGDKVDTTLFRKYGDLYFPNYLDGWTIENFDKLPAKYQGLPIAIWQLRTDSSIALTLLNNIVLKITVSDMTEKEQEYLSKMLSERFETKGTQRSYEETHPLQPWITYWNLKTWETKDVIFQIGNSDMRKPEEPIPKEVRWNLVYSDFILENKIINDYRKR